MLALLLLLQALIVAAIPAFDGLSGRFSVGLLCQALPTYRPWDLFAIMTITHDTFQPKFQVDCFFYPHPRPYSNNHTGQPGNLTVLPNPRTPPLFFINQNQLWQFNNESTIYSVNFVNTTRTAEFPLQLVLERSAPVRAGHGGGEAPCFTMIKVHMGIQDYFIPAQRPMVTYTIRV
ncbi:hypothetical protein BD779DRAFT_1781972 [Infundibulicybe gibba]|nr:hypothetical protein BD779DRAFT_1781972 [Infundibulicybe gibba]